MSDFLTTITNDPLSLLNEHISDNANPLLLAKSYVDEVIQSQKKDSGTGSLLDEIVIDGLDSNQVWQQVKVVLENNGSRLLEKIGDLRMTTQEFSGSDSEAESAEELETRSSEDQDDSDIGASSEAENSEDDTKSRPVDDMSGSDNAEEEVEESYGENDESDEKESAVDKNEVEKIEVVSKNPDKYGVNDGFFDLDEFNRQTLDAEDVSEGDDEVNYFEDIPSEDDEEAVYYGDFFDKPTFDSDRNSAAKDVQKNDDLESDSEEEIDRAMESAKLDLFADVADEDADLDSKDTEKLSSFQRQQLDIQRQISQLEKEAVADKKWALKGEVKAADRPDDALLTEDLEFERTSKPVPVITSEITESLEDMIRRRILQGEFDDLARRVMANTRFSTPRPQFELSDAKSSKSLAALYEDDYKNVPEDSEKSEESVKAHGEISELYNNLVYKLDALSSAHFIPKPAQKSLDIKVQAAAITMEDAQPLTMSTAPTLAPQEVYAPGASRGLSLIHI